MKNKPKKIAACLELNKQELQYLICGISELSRIYIGQYNRDFDTEDLHDKVKSKLENALSSLEIND